MTNWSVGRAPPIHLGASGSFTARASQVVKQTSGSTSAPSSAWYSPTSPQRCLQGPPTNVVRAVSPLGSGRLSRGGPSRSATSPTGAFRANAYASGSLPSRSTSGQCRSTSGQSVSTSMVSISVAPPGSTSAPPGPPAPEGVFSGGSGRVAQTWRMSSPTSQPVTSLREASPSARPVKSGLREVPMSRLSASHHAPSSASTSATSGTPEVNKGGEPPSLRSSRGTPEQNSRPDSLPSTHGSLQVPPKVVEQGQWSASHSFRLGPRADLGQVRVLDRTVVGSVTTAVDQLNRGGLSCPEGICAVYSASTRSYYCLHRAEMQEAAHTNTSRVIEEGSPKPEVLYLGKGKGRTRGAVHVRRIQSVPTMGDSQQVDGAPDDVENCIAGEDYDRLLNVEAPGTAPYTGVGSVATLLETEEPPKSMPSSLVAGAGPVLLDSPVMMNKEVDGANHAAPVSLPRRAKTPEVMSRARALSPDRVVKKAPSEKASPPPLHVRRAEHSPTYSSLRSPIVNLSGSGAALRPVRKEPSATMERASSAQGSSPPTHFSPRMQKRAVNASSPSGKTWTSPPAVSSSSPSHQVRSEAEYECDVDIANRTFQLHQVVGRGAFGIVWLAQEKSAPGSKDIAVKAVSAKDAASFATAAFEAELLQILTAAMPASSRNNVPQYIAHSATKLSGGGGIVRLAMSFVPGGALDKWLYGISDEEHKTVDVAQLVDGHLPGGQQGSWLFTNACSIVRSLLSQLAAVFSALQPIAFHRDVSSHNVLVDFPDGELSLRPSFALIDFGLAVRSGSWIREWRNSNLAGDPRYWTPSAWMAFAFGFKYVATHPNSGFQQQYLARMDHFSLGVLGLEALFALWNTGEAYEGKHPGLLEVRAAWCKYWVAVIHLFQMFHRQGASEVRQFLAQSQDEGVTCLCNHLRQLRQSLWAAAAHPLNSRYAALLRVVADLIDERGTVTWTEIPSMLGEDSGEAASPPSPSPRESTARCSRALADPQPSAADRIEHRRIRSTGGTVDQELRRFEPEISQVLFKTMSQQASPLASPLASQTTGTYSPDLLSRSFTHSRPMSGFM